MGSFLIGASGSIAACGGDDSTGTTDQDSGSDVTTTPTDSGGQSDTSAGDSNTETAKANAADITIYFGQIASLDATASTPATVSFAWTIESAPPGSTVVTSSILNAATAKPTFTPDVAGDYSVKLTVTSGSATDSKTVKVKAVHTAVFYVNQNNQTDAGGRTTDLRFVSSGGTDGHSIMCGVPDDAGNNATTTARTYSAGSDWWEAPPGGESRVVFTMDERLGDAGYESYLAAATSTSSCTGTKPKKLDSMPNANALLQIGQLYSPKLSPDGTRVLYIRNLADTAGTRIATVGFDGQNAHLAIAPFNAYPDGGAQADSGLNYFDGNSKAPVRWAPNNKVAWSTAFNNGARWQIFTADDADNATPTPFMTCNGRLAEFDFLADGSVIASAGIPVDGAVAPLDLYVLRPNAVTKECEVVKNLTNLTNGTTSAATDFSLSPDKRRVAFLMIDTTVDAGAGIPNSALFTAAVDGSQPPARVPGVPYGAAARTIFQNGPGQGPRWLAGGTALSWGQTTSTFDAGDGGGFSVAVVSAGGGNIRAVATSSATDSVFAIGNVPNMCSIGHGTGSALMAFGSLAAFVGLVARRRRRR